MRTTDDIHTAVKRLDVRIPFAHQVLIVNFYDVKGSATGSFLFVRLAPITSVQATGLSANLNTSTYSVLNLIRQLNEDREPRNVRTKRYAFNDCVLNRLMKSYLFASRQMMTVLKIEPQHRQTDG